MSGTAFFYGQEQAARDELTQALKSEQLRRAPKLRALLTYLFNETLNGREPTEETLVKSVFGRAELKPRDALVRVALHSLRKILAEYYAAEGRAKSHELRIPERRNVVHWSARPQTRIAFPAAARFLRAMCREMEVGDAEKDRRLRQWLDTDSAREVTAFLQHAGLDPANLTLDQLVGAMEKNDRGDIGFNDFSRLTGALDFHQLLVDSLQSRETGTDETCLKLELDASFFSIGLRNEKSYGEGREILDPGQPAPRNGRRVRAPRSRSRPLERLA
jgi:hypothetical protein